MAEKSLAKLDGNILTAVMGVESILASFDEGMQADEDGEKGGGHRYS